MQRSVAIIGTRGYPSYYGGFETAVRRLAPFLAERGWGVTVYGRPGGIQTTDATADSRVESRVTRGVESRSLSTLSYGLTSSIDAAKRRPDVALVMNVANGYFLPLLKSRGIPSVVNVDGIEWERAKWNRLGKTVFYRGAKQTARSATRLIFDAHAIADYWAHEFHATGDVIPYGGDLANGDLPLEEGLNHRGYVLSVARFVPENTVAEFFGAARRLSEFHDVVIVGSSGYGGEFDDRAAELARTCPRVQWLGHVSDDERLHALWQHAGAYFHGHSVGGTNPALVQAIALGAPTVARDTIFNREVLGEDAGVFTQPDPESIFDGLMEVMSDPKLQGHLSAAAIARARQSYTWKAICEAYEQSLVAAILSRSSGRKSL